MKPKFLLFFFLFALLTSGFSQEAPINLLPDTDVDVTLNITTKEGYPTGLVLPVILHWDKDDSSIQLEIKTVKFDKPIYLFSGLMTFSNVQKIKKEILFSKEMARNTSPKKSVRSISNTWLENLMFDSPEAIKGKGKVYNLCEPPGAVFKFKISNRELESCAIKIYLYLATIEKGKKEKNNHVIESITEVNVKLDFFDPCKEEELMKIIELLDNKAFQIGDEAAFIQAEAEELPDIAERTVRTYKPRLPAKDKKIQNIADPQFNKYKDCRNLLTVIEKYNTALDDHEKAVTLYNNNLEERKKSTPTTTGNSCQFLKTANEKLMNLYYRIEQSNKSNYPNLKKEYNKIKEQTEVNEKCREYAAFNEWCKGIEKLLK